ncbi:MULTISPECIES: DUF4156 domain-containing protein [unclassified Acinetobacter]|uniref:DUF4156 domain-containing protein n=1 Tax=unclassified Acinetobacter TaxID=196816 RepID=UPI002934A442|nr:MULTISPECIES: DUF4156 domain-containing protein [unclassified Acinetobacter]WOE33263.1 DUF4156 domain-containing protein [Acinetobacter sp. SAAs470]WOE36956.1 DUF4156 domain-containing protein [Acinetobacter sp. SAAs474]
MKKILSLLALPLFLAACSAIPLQPGAQNIRVLNTDPKDCTFVGIVTGKQGDWLRGQVVSNANLEEGALNDLRNKALALGGNTISIITNRAGSTGIPSSKGTDYAQTNVVITGNVWKCNY